MAVALATFRVLAACTSLFMLLSPTPMVYKMYKSKDTGVMSIVPLVAVLVNSHVWMLYGFIDKNYFPVFATFVAGDFIAATYVIVYYRYSTARASNHRVFAAAALILVATTVYVVLGSLELTGQSRHAAAQIAGVMADTTAIMLYASPLVKILHVFRHRSAGFIPIHMVCAGSTNNIMWMVYAILAEKWIILVPALGSLSIGVFQIVLYFFVFHPSTHPLPDAIELLAQKMSQFADVELSVIVQQSPKPDALDKSSAFLAVESPTPQR